MAKSDVTVVLAHGAWADGSSWARVITALAAEGIKAQAAPLPLTSLADDVAALNRSLDRTAGPIVLAGHAYAGAVIALARPERLKALVYVAALAPDEGEKVADGLNLFVYPNPTNGGFALEFRLEKKQRVWITLTSGADGRICYTETLDNFSGYYHRNLDQLRLAKGNYAVTVRTETATKTIILVKY